MNLIEATLSKLSNIQFYLRNLDEALYREPLEILSFASIGEHTRHILEFYQCLLHQCAYGTINYDLRNRDKLIQEDPEKANEVLVDIIQSLHKTESHEPLCLEMTYDEDKEFINSVETSLERELVYNLEHVIHHLAIIKIGLAVITPRMILPEGFGVASSTMRFKRTSCAP
jgi:hypothetical protein